MLPFLNKNNIIIFFTAALVFLAWPVYAQEAFSATAPKKEDLTQLQRQARLYRDQGLKFQNTGNIREALAFYQKAAELDPSYAVVHNDLGVVYESMGRSELAEMSYFKAIKLDPNYLSAYSNLALFYEGRRDLDRAAFYWKKRVELGSPGDPWTDRAKARLNDLAQVSPNYRQMMEESETLSLMRQVAAEKLKKEKEDALKFRQSFDKAKKLYAKRQYEEALEELNQALSLAPQGQEQLALAEKIKGKIEEAQKKARLKERKEKVKRMKEYFEYAIRDYEEGNLETAQFQLDKIIELAVPPQEE